MNVEKAVKKIEPKAVIQCRKFDHGIYGTYRSYTVLRSPRSKFALSGGFNRESLAWADALRRIEKEWE